MNDKIATLDGTIYLILELRVLGDKEARYILRECLLPQTSAWGEDETEDLGNEDL